MLFLHLLGNQLIRIWKESSRTLFNWYAGAINNSPVLGFIIASLTTVPGFLERGWWFTRGPEWSGPFWSQPLEKEDEQHGIKTRARVWR